MSADVMIAPAAQGRRLLADLAAWASANRMAATGLGLVLFWIAMALLAPLLPLPPPDKTFTPLLPPMARVDGVGVFWLGADQLGRDELSRIVWGARRVLVYGPAAVGASYVLGILSGALAGYQRGWVDEVLSRIADLILSLPAIPLFVVVISEFGASAISILACIVFTNTPRVMRMVRGLVIEARDAGYVRAARMRGESSLYIVLVEILPNIKEPLIVDACVRIGYVIIAIGALGFLGLGLPPPAANWGTMIAEGREVLLAAPHVVLAPCLALLSFVIGCNLLADGLKRGESGRS